MALTDTDLRPKRPGRKHRTVMRRVGHALYFALFGVLLAIGLTLGIGSAVAPGTTTYWGTFTAHSCHPAKYGCTWVGAWVSDSGSIVKNDTALDGSVNSDSTARASYTPTGFNNDAQNNVVHAADWAWISPWVPWLMSLLAIAFIVGHAVSLWRIRPKATN